jgi:hypothetical protein
MPEFRQVYTAARYVTQIGQVYDQYHTHPKLMSLVKMSQQKCEHVLRKTF